MEQLQFGGLPARLPLLRVLHETPAQRVVQAGPRAVSLHELVGAILGDPDVALRVLAEHPTVNDLARLHAPELERVKGMGPARVAALMAAIEFGRRVTLGEEVDRKQIRSPSDAASILMSEMGLLEQEELWVMLLDTRNYVLALEKVYKGNVNTSVVRTSEIFREAIRRNAPAIIVAHNHPSRPDPSPEDISVTRNIIEAGKLLDIDCIDHIVVSRQAYVSMKERGLAF